MKNLSSHLKHREVDTSGNHKNATQIASSWIFAVGRMHNWKGNHYLIGNDTPKVKLRAVEQKESENTEKKCSLIMNSSGLWKNP